MTRYFNSQGIIVGWKGTGLIQATLYSLLSMVYLLLKVDYSNSNFGKKTRWNFVRSHIGVQMKVISFCEIVITLTTNFMGIMNSNAKDSNGNVIQSLISFSNLSSFDGRFTISNLVIYKQRLLEFEASRVLLQLGKNSLKIDTHLVTYYVWYSNVQYCVTSN